jgi:hypothetical protein
MISMSVRPTSLIFTQPADFIPSGVPLETWEVISDINCSYEVEPSGRLIRKDRIDGTRWVTHEFTGSITATIVPKHSPVAHMFVLSVVCGMVKHMTPVQQRALSPLQALQWCWVLEDLVVDREGIEASGSYRGCLELIQQAEGDEGYKSNDAKLDAMVGMALCRPALLQSKSARNALECLEDYQLRAISSWHRAHLSS